MFRRLPLASAFVCFSVSSCCPFATIHHHLLPVHKPEPDCERSRLAADALELLEGGDVLPRVGFGRRARAQDDAPLHHPSLFAGALLLCADDEHAPFHLDEVEPERPRLGEGDGVHARPPRPEHIRARLEKGGNKHRDAEGALRRTDAHKGKLRQRRHARVHLVPGEARAADAKERRHSCGAPGEGERRCGGGADDAPHRRHSAQAGHERGGGETPRHKQSRAAHQPSAAHLGPAQHRSRRRLCRRGRW
mmetsp:Transcript_11550/g.37943  ORF Transcript_11550/g.37943 Transcript_11550/m.37943 type:complete len:249 (+) Transcript_11550:459-1205(+)